MIRQFHVLPIALLMSGCTDFDEPSAVDPSPVLGCYATSDAPAFSVQREGIRIAQNSTILPFRYEQRKAGMVLKIPMAATMGEDGLELRQAREHLYPVVWTDATPIIRVAFGSDGIIRDYKWQSPNIC